MSRRLFLWLVAAASAVVGATTALAQPSQWTWQRGDSTASIGEQVGSSDLFVTAARDATVHGRRVVLTGEDGNFEFESFSPDQELHAYPIGSDVRTPLAFGAVDREDVTALVVSGVAQRSVDLEQWSLSGKPLTAIDLQGRPRIEGIALSTRRIGGKIALVATLPDGTQQILRPMG